MDLWECEEIDGHKVIVEISTYQALEEMEVNHYEKSLFGMALRNNC